MRFTHPTNCHAQTGLDRGPEVAENVSTDKSGELELSTEEEAAVVAFLKTLSDEHELLPE